MNRIVPRTAAAVAIMAVGATMATGMAGTADAATPAYYAYGGNAFGSHVTLGSLVNVGKTAYTPMCTTKAGAKGINRTAKVDLGAVGYIGAVTSEVRSRHQGGVMRSAASSHTAYTSLLAGAIKLGAVATHATVAYDGSGYSSSGSSTFVGLKIAGMSFPVSPTPNSTYSLPGLGSLTLNEQKAGTHNGIPTMKVTAIDLVLGSSNALGLPTGRVVIGQSTASLRKVHRVPTGGAWATQISVASLVGSGRTAAVYTGCGGTGNAGRTNDLTGLTLPNGVATVGVAKSTVHTTDTAAKTTSTSRNRIAGVNLLNGMIKLKALATEARAVATSTGKHTLSSDGTSVLGLVVDGQAIAAPPLGQKQSIPGLGTLEIGYAHKHHGTGITVYGLRLVLGSAQGALPAGAVITVGAARAGVAG